MKSLLKIMATSMKPDFYVKKCYMVLFLILLLIIIKTEGIYAQGGLTFTPNPLDFGTINIGDQSVKQIQIHNNYNSTIQIYMEVIGGEGDSSNQNFNILSSITDSIGAFQDLFVNIEFSPILSGEYFSYLSVYVYNFESNYYAGLTGVGEIPPLILSTTFISFGYVKTGEYQDRIITLTNNSPVNVTIRDFSFSNETSEFSIVSPPIPDIVSPYSSKDIVISFAPVSQDIFSTTLYLYTNSANSPYSISLSGTSILSPPVVTPDELDFGIVSLEQSSVKMIQIYNPNNYTIHIYSYINNGEGEGISDYRIVSGIDSIAPLQTGYLNVEFTPLETGIRLTQLYIYGDEFNEQIIVNLTGIGGIPPLIISETNLDFGNVTLNNSAFKIVTVTNSSSIVTTISDIEFSGVFENEFTLNNDITLPIDLQPNNSVNLVIKFSPVIAGNKNAILIIHSNTISEIDVVQLKGTATIPALILSSTSIDFGNVYVNESLGRTITLTNNSSSEITIQMPSFIGNNQNEFSLKDISYPKIISAENFLDIEITFIPLGKGIRNAFLLIPSNTISSPDTIELTGTGIISSDLILSENSVDFGNVNVNESTSRTIQLTNNGSEEITIQEPIFSGNNSEDFNLSNESFPKIIDSESTLDLTIVFTPKASGNREAIMLIFSDVSDGADTLELHGNGKMIPLVLSAKNIDFGKTEVNSNLQKNITLKNNNNAVVTIQNILLLGSNNSEFNVISFPNSINNNDSTDIIIVFSPISPGIKNAYMLIFSNSSSIPDSVALFGSAVLPITVQSTHANLEESAVVTISPPSGFEFNDNHFYYRMTGEKEYQETNLLFNGDNYQANIPANYSTIRGIEYYVIFSDGENTITYPLESPENNPASLQINVPEIIYPNDLISLAYRMISVPLSISDPQLSSVLEDDYNSYNEVLWRVFRWDPGNSSYLEYSDINSNLLPGNAFWLITREGKEFFISNALSVRSDSAYTIILQPGYNQIGNPFAFPVTWSDVINSSLVGNPVRYNPDIKDYDNLNVSILEPWEGYFVFNSDSLNQVVLRVLPVESPTGVMEKMNDYHRIGNGFVLQVKSNLELTNIQDHQNYVGMSNDAKDNYDKFDILEPPPITNEFNLSIISDNKKYAQNIVALSFEGACWNIDLSTEFPDKNVNLLFEEKTPIPENFKLWLLDKGNKITIPVINNSATIDMSDGNKKSLKLIIGTDKYAEKVSENISLVPLEFILFQNFPNPFNPETNIYYALKENSIVTLEIYDILGRKVKSFLTQQLQNGGLHYIKWDGKDYSGNYTASGIYIYTLRANDFFTTKKMILLK